MQGRPFQSGSLASERVRAVRLGQAARRTGGARKYPRVGHLPSGAGFRYGALGQGGQQGQHVGRCWDLAGALHLETRSSST